MLEFDERYHSYRWDGIPVPSVTSILDANGHVSDFCKSQPHADRGTNIHLMIHLDVKGGSDEDRLNLDMLKSTYQAEWEQWQSFKRLTSFVPVASEELVHASIGFVTGEDFGDRYVPDWAGTKDLSGYINGSMAVIDIKTGKTIPPHARLQLAAYTIAGHPMDFWDIKRYALRISGHFKNFKLTEYKEDEDYIEWVKEVRKHKRNQLLR